MNKKVKVIFNILIAAASVVFLSVFAVMVGSFRYANREIEDPVGSELDVFEYRLEHKAYGEILKSYYSKRLDNIEAPGGLEDIYNVAGYAHAAFMSGVYEQKGDERMIRGNAAKMENLRNTLGSYAYTADEIDAIINDKKESEK